MADPSSQIADQRFAALIESFATDDAVTVGQSRGFGSGALQVDGHIFAMVSGGRLVLKLPGDRVAGLVESGQGIPFDGGKGRPLREWVSLRDGADVPVLELAQEARTFGAARAR